MNSNAAGALQRATFPWPFAQSGAPALLLPNRFRGHRPDTRRPANQAFSSPLAAVHFHTAGTPRPCSSLPLKYDVRRWSPQGANQIQSSTAPLRRARRRNFCSKDRRDRLPSSSPCACCPNLPVPNSPKSNSSLFCRPFVPNKLLQLRRWVPLNRKTSADLDRVDWLPISPRVSLASGPRESRKHTVHTV